MCISWKRRSKDGGAGDGERERGRDREIEQGDVRGRERS